MWALRGSRPRVIRQTEYQNLHIFAAVCPKTGQAEGMFIEGLNSEVMSCFLDQISKGVEEKKHLILILDRAGYHLSKRLKVPENMTLIYLPAYSPELNPVENLWHYLRSHHWSNRYYKDMTSVEEAAQQGWENVCFDENKIKTICAAHYVK